MKQSVSDAKSLSSLCSLSTVDYKTKCQWHHTAILVKLMPTSTHHPDSVETDPSPYGLGHVGNTVLCLLTSPRKLVKIAYSRR